MKVLRGRHTFPNRRITWRVRRARKRYTCDALERTCASGHSEIIERGDDYVGVGIRPDEYQPRGWTHLRFCVACAASWGLVDLELEELPT